MPWKVHLLLLKSMPTEFQHTGNKKSWDYPLDAFPHLLTHFIVSVATQFLQKESCSQKAPENICKCSPVFLCNILGSQPTLKHIICCQTCSRMQPYLWHVMQQDTSEMVENWGPSRHFEKFTKQSVGKFHRTSYSCPWYGICSLSILILSTYPIVC